MRLLLDECVPRDLKRDLIGHQVVTVVEAAFGGMKNGALLAAAANSYDVFITVDRSLPFQQNIHTLPVAVLIIRAGGITYSDLKVMIPEILRALTTIEPKQLLQIRTPMG